MSKKKLKLETFDKLKAKWMKDPDKGLELQDWVIKRIESIRSRNPCKNISLAQMRKKHLN